MQIKKGYEITNKDKNYFIVSKDDPNNLISISEYGAFLWQLLSEKELTKNQMLDGLLNNFDISTVLALGEIDNFLRTMRENEIIE